MPFGSLWLPVVVATVVVWLASAILHMLLKYHRADIGRLANEDAIAAALGKDRPAPGVYALPYCADMAQMKDPAYVKKYQDGPVALVTVLRNGVPAIGKHLVQWLLLCFLVSFTVGYVARHTLHPGADGMLVLQVTGAVALAAYAYGYLQDSIWKGIPWGNSLRGILDAVIYAVLTGLAFRFFWPAA